MGKVLDWFWDNLKGFVLVTLTLVLMILMYTSMMDNPTPVMKWVWCGSLILIPLVAAGLHYLDVEEITHGYQLLVTVCTVVYAGEYSAFLSDPIGMAVIAGIIAGLGLCVGLCLCEICDHCRDFKSSSGIFFNDEDFD
ncbi:MAG: hypothetical protein IJ864_00600 [Alphaproteobacteria bacterium]|nr:hypothetical protein [Alphaproteobacteria bacterium]